MNEELKIIITAECQQMKKQIEDIEKQLGGFEKTGSKAGANVTKAMKGIGKATAAAGKAIATGIGLASAALVGLTAKAVSSAGELEQNIGGSKQVFQEFSNDIQGYAKEAYSQLGLSTSEYLATANKMGALLQGSGFSIQESMELTTATMQRAADVASIMGIDTSAAMDAIAGAAKGNFTMMDNLGVAINATTIEEYALAQGINKAYTEMTTQEKEALALQLFMEKTAYATGNYAKENETLAGSLSTAQAAFDNFLNGSGSAEQLIDALTNAGQVIIENIVSIAPQLVEGINQLLQGIMPMLPGMIEQLLPVIVTGAITLINGLVAMLPDLIQILLDNLPLIISGIFQIMDAVLQALTTSLPMIIDAVVQVLPQIVSQLLAMLPQLITLGITLIVALIEGITQVMPDVIQAFIDMLPDIINALVQGIPDLLQAGIELFMAIVEAIPVFLPQLIDMLPDIINTIINTLLDNLPMLLDAGVQLFMALVESIPIIIPELINGLADIVSSVTTNLINKLLDLMGFDWELPKLKLPHITISGEFSLAPPSIPKFGISWYAKGGVFDEKTLFGYGNGLLGGLGENGAEAVVPLEKNTQWLDRIAERLGGNAPIYLTVDGRVLGEVTVDNINSITRQRGKIPLNIF